MAILSTLVWYLPLSVDDRTNGCTEGNYGPRLLRLGKVTNFSVHDIALVDAGAFHLVLDTCTNGEIYNMIVRGGNEGGLDGIDVWGNNIHVHDVEVTNKDECVTVKVGNPLPPSVG